MEALRAQSPKSGFHFETVPIPSLAADDVLIKVATAGISPGAVKMTKYGRAHTPGTLGHEAAGTIAAVGEDVRDLPLGTRVRLHPTLNCGSCFRCTRGEENMCDSAALIGFAKFGKDSALYDRYHDGTVAKYVRAPRRLIDVLPDNVSMEVGAKVHDVATALRALKLAVADNTDTGRDSTSTLVLTAATGAMGTLTLKMAHLFPLKKIILVGRSESRMEQVRKLTSVPTELFVIEGGTGFESESESSPLVPHLRALAPECIDAILDYMPTGDILPRILPALRTGGTLVHMGGNMTPTPMPLGIIMNNCWKVTGNRANTREDVVEVLRWLSEGKLDVSDLITHRFDFEHVDKMLDLVENRREPVWLSVLHVNKDIV